MAGMMLVALNPAYRGREMRLRLTQSGAAGLFCVDEYRGFDMRELAGAARGPACRACARSCRWSPGTRSSPAATTDAAARGQAARHDPGPVHLRHDRLPQRRDAAPQGPGQRGHVRGRAGGHVRRRRVHQRDADVPHRRRRGDLVRRLGQAGHLRDPAGLRARAGTGGVRDVPGHPHAAGAHHAHRDAGPSRPGRPATCRACRRSSAGRRRCPRRWCADDPACSSCQFSILFGQTEAHGVVSQTRVTDSPEDQARRSASRCRSWR